MELGDLREQVAAKTQELASRSEVAFNNNIDEMKKSFAIEKQELKESLQAGFASEKQGL